MALGVLGDNVKKMCNLHQIINKYINKVPIFFPIFWHREFPFFYFLPFLLVDALNLLPTVKLVLRVVSSSQVVSDLGLMAW